MHVLHTDWRYKDAPTHTHTYVFLVSRQRDVSRGIRAQKRGWRFTVCPTDKNMNDWVKKQSNPLWNYNVCFPDAVCHIHTCSNSAQKWKKLPWACKNSRSSRIKKRQPRGAAAQQRTQWSPVKLSDGHVTSPWRQHPGASVAPDQWGLMVRYHLLGANGLFDPLNLKITKVETWKQLRNINATTLQARVKSSN